MKITKIKTYAVALVSAGLLGLLPQAEALVILDTSSSEYLGEIINGAPSSPSDEASYINYLRTQTLNTTVVDAVGNNDITRSGNSFVGLPEATATGADKDDTSPSNQIDVTGWTYLLAKYGGNSLVWVVSAINDVVQVPGAGLSHWSTYNPGDDTTTGVPDAGATLILLGAGLLGIGAFRKKMS